MTDHLGIRGGDLTINYETGSVICRFPHWGFALRVREGLPRIETIKAARDLVMKHAPAECSRDIQPMVNILEHWISKANPAQGDLFAEASA